MTATSSFDATAAGSWQAIPRPADDELCVVVGPTASGKTELALRLAEAWQGEIVGADSVQIYRAFDIGSGKPTSSERARAPHHLIDVFDPNEAVDAQRYAEMADALVREIRGRGRVPIVCGGTFLWVRALTLGLAPAPPADAAIRAQHAAFVETEGRASLHDRLARVDPTTARRLAPNDMVRVSRALEVFELTQRPLSSWHEEHGFRVARHRARLVGVAHTREALDDRIERRAAAWLDEGWIDEVRALCERGFASTRPMGSVGYKQVRAHVDGDLARADLLPTIVRATRTFVRRQRTWLKDEPVFWATL